jgi:hypothetical protein
MSTTRKSHLRSRSSAPIGANLAGPNYTIGANLGKQVDRNLFHSFGELGPR